MEEEGGGWRWSGRQRGNTTDVRKWQRDGDSKDTRLFPFWTGGATQGCLLQTETQTVRRTDPKWLCHPVLSQSVRDSTMKHHHLTNVSRCCHVDDAGTPSQPSRVVSEGM